MAEPTSANEGNDSLHIAARSGQEEIMLQILSRRPTLIYHQNMRGDNPLHIAAKAGHLGIVELLISFFQSLRLQIEAIWKTKNNDGNTALHEALRNKHEDVALHLLDVDNEPFLGPNLKYESPLYLAAKAGFARVLQKILEAGRNPIGVWPKGQTPFHAAVFAKSKESIEVLYGSIVELINERDSAGKTALYYATQEDSLEIIHQLLELDASSALITDRVGLSPLLVAIRKGRLESVLAILNACPSSFDSSNSNGNNALHLAVIHNNIETFKTLLSFPKIRALVNKGNLQEDTPLHLAIAKQKYQHAQALLQLRNVKYEATNSTGQTALDLCPSQENLSDEQRQIRDGLENASNFSYFLWRYFSSFLWRYLSTGSQFMDEKLAMQALYRDKGLSEATNVLSVVAALIAAATFAAVLQMPGGYFDDGSPKLMDFFTFKAFVVADTLALCLSLFALHKLIVASTKDKTSAVNIERVLSSIFVLRFALMFTMLAFCFVIDLVIIRKCGWLGYFVSVICSIIIISIIFDPVFDPKDF